MVNRDKRRPAHVRGQDFKEHMYHGRVRLVEHGVVDIAALEKKVPGLVDNCPIRKDVGHLASGDLPYSRAEVVVLANITSWLESQFSDPQLVLTVEVSEGARNNLLKLNPRSKTFGVYAHRTGGAYRLRDRASRLPK